MTGLEVATAADLADAGAFLARVLRLDSAALVRLRTAGAGRVELWAWLPLTVLVSRVVGASLGGAGSGPGDPDRGPDDPGGGRDDAGGPAAAAGDVTLGAADLLRQLEVARAGKATSVVLPARRDTEWRGTLPGRGAVTPLDTVPADVVEGLVAAGEAAFRGTPLAAPGADPRAVGESLLGHESLRVSAGGTSVAVPLGMLLSVARMGFLAGEGLSIGVVGGWVRADAHYGTAYRRREGVSSPLLLSPL